MYRKIKNYYDNKLWSIQQVKDVVGKKVITPEEYHKITGLVYPDTGENSIE